MLIHTRMQCQATLTLMLEINYLTYDMQPKVHQAGAGDVPITLSCL